MHQQVSGDEPPPVRNAYSGGTLLNSIFPAPKTGGGLSVFWAAVVFLWASSSTAQVFSYVDKSGTPKLTDNFFELPQSERARLLKVFEKRAAKKYSPTQIGHMKATGKWPPLDIIKTSLQESKANKANSERTNYSELQKAAKKIRTNLTTQRSALNQEKKALKTRLPHLEKTLQDLKNQEMTAYAKDLANRSVGEAGFLHQLHQKIQKLEKEKTALLKMKNGGLRNKERRINRGELVYRN